MWPFGKRDRETRAAFDVSGATPWPADATELAIRSLHGHAAGTRTDSNALGVVQAAVGAWERAIASATVSPASVATAALTPSVLALTGRALATVGEVVFAIRVDRDGVQLLPAASLDVTGGADPSSWRYRLSLAGPSAEAVEVVPAEAVLHFRLGADHKSPWRGRSPWRRSSVTAQTAALIEAAIQAEARIPAGRVAPYPGVPDQVATYAAQLRQGGLIVTGAANAMTSHAAGGQEPAARWRPQKLGPEPDPILPTLREGHERAILAAFGLPPALFSERGDGAGQREAWRRAWSGTWAPVARMIAAECEAKLDVPGCVLDLAPLRASDEDGRSRAVARRAAAFKTFVDAGLSRAEAMRLAGLAD